MQMKKIDQATHTKIAAASVGIAPAKPTRRFEGVGKDLLALANAELQSTHQCEMPKQGPKQPWRPPPELRA
jgi:hypothetical protein